MMTLRAPFPYFGGKRKVAAMIWQRFGDVRNYVEPFFGSGAVLLQRPTPFVGVETVNDADGFISNFWRAIRYDPVGVWKHADWPVNEADLCARHYWLITDGRERLASVLGFPDGYDAKVAGWWVWGICSWIGSGWCSGRGPWSLGNDGVWTKTGGLGVTHTLPRLSGAGSGINRKLPDGVDAWFAALSCRLRKTRVAHGDWSRVVGPSVTCGRGVTGVFLDPPYSSDERAGGIYAHDDGSVAAAAREWALEAGRRDDMRICLAGYDTEHDMPGWDAVRWKADGGYGNQGNGRGRENAKRETLWFSPACLPKETGVLI